MPEAANTSSHAGGSSSEGSVFCLSLEVPLPEQHSLEEFIHALGLDQYSSETNTANGTAVLSLYRTQKSELEETKQYLQDRFEDWVNLLNGTYPTISEKVIRKKDWSESWKEHFHAFKATDRLVIKPSWEQYESKDGEIVIEIDPGMSFGTGYHGTTLACLEFIDRISQIYPGTSFLDAGCGSGILALAAVKLGFTPVHLFDNDRRATKIARQHMHTADTSQTVNISTAELEDYQPPFPFHVVVANILAPVLLENAENLTQTVQPAENPPAYLILSGIQTEKYPDVRERFQDLGFTEKDVRTIAEWTSGWFERRD